MRTIHPVFHIAVLNTFLFMHLLFYAVTGRHAH